MKIELNYDLIDKIATAKGEYKLKRCNKFVLKRGAPQIVGLSILCNSIVGFITNSTLEQTISNTITSFLLVHSTFVSAMLFSAKLTNKATGITFEELAQRHLGLLSSELSKINIKTSLPLLLDSKEYHREYKIISNEEGIQGIIQRKYINIPTYDNGTITETSILQEHQLETKKYVLSLGHPTQQKSFKPVYGL